MGGPQCRMSNLRNGYVNCHYFSNFHIDFKMVPCQIRIKEMAHVMSIISFLMSITMSHVGFKN